MINALDIHSDEDGRNQTIDELQVAEDVQIDNARAQLEACKSDYLRLQLQMSYLTDQSDRWSQASSQLQQLKEDIMLLETKISGSETQYSSTQDITEMETLTEDDPPIPQYHPKEKLTQITPQDQIDEFEHAPRILETRQYQATANQNQFHPQEEITSIMGTTITTRLPSVIHEHVIIDTEDDISSVGASTLTTLPPSMVEFTPQYDAFSQQEDALTLQDDAFDDNVRFSEVSKVFDPTLEIFDADETPIVRATPFTEPKHKRHFVPLVCIICILTAAIFGAVFGVQKNDSQPMLLLAADSLPPSSAPSMSFSPSLSLSPSSCDPYRVVPRESIFECGECDPMINIYANNAIIANIWGKKLHFFNMSDEGKFEKVGTAAIEASTDGKVDVTIHSIAISDSFAVVGLPEYNNHTGTAFIFEKNSSGIWNQVLEVEPYNITEDAMFGESIDIYNDVIVISASNDADKGSTLIYRRVNSTWMLEEKIMPTNSSGWFGGSLSLKRDILAVSDAWYIGDADGTYVSLYKFDNGQWNQFANITNQNCPHNFGISVVLTDDLELMMLCDKNAIYHYTQSNNGTYVLQQKITPSIFPDNADGYYRYDLAIDGNNMILGTNSDFSVEFYLFSREDDAWVETKQIEMSNSSWFGSGPNYFALSGDLIFVASESNIHSHFIEDC